MSLLPAMAVQIIFPIDLLSLLAELHMARRGVMRQRHNAHRQPGTTVGCEGKRRDLVVHQIAILTILDMEVVVHEAAAAFIYGLLIEALEAHFINLGEHGLLVGGDVVDVEAVAHLLHLLGRVSAQEQRIAGHMQETLPEVVDDIYALVGRIGHRVDGAYHGVEMPVLLVIHALDTVSQRKEVFNFSHIGFQVYGSANIPQMLYPCKR